jgi:hypothetical protein
MHARKRDWVALMINIDPEDFRANPNLEARTCWVRIPGKHKNLDTAWDVFEAMRATKH